MAHSMDKQDISSSASSPHRLPTLSAAEILQDLHSPCKQPISTGLRRLDAILQGKQPDTAAQDGPAGGFARGQVAEIWGPAGVGKTAFAMQVAANALRTGIPVVWIDGSYELVGSRLSDFLSQPPLFDSEKDSSPSTAVSRVRDDLLKNLHHFTTPTLSHLLVLLAHSSSCFPPEKAGLMVIDGISSLFAVAFPKTIDIVDYKQTPEKKKNDVAQWAAGRRWAVLGDVISSLTKLAALRNMAILLTIQATIKITAETGAILHPFLASTAWDSGISAHIVLFRDWAFQSSKEPCHRVYVPRVRFAGVLKAAGISHTGVDVLVPFVIEKHGLRSIDVESQSYMAHHSGSMPTSRKRKSDLISESQPDDDEIGSDEEFGWAEDEPFATHNLTSIPE